MSHNNSNNSDNSNNFEDDLDSFSHQLGCDLLDEAECTRQCKNVANLGAVKLCMEEHNKWSKKIAGKNYDNKGLRKEDCENIHIIGELL